MEQESESMNSFTCLDPEQGKQLPAFIDGTLEQKERSVFEAHIKYCARCSEDYLLRREAEARLRNQWPEIAPDQPATEPQGGGGPWTLLLRWRVPALVPVALAAAILLLVIPRLTTDSPDQQAWRPVTGVQQLHVAGKSRGAGETLPAKTVKPGELLEITLGRIPAAGEPIVLVISGAGGAVGGPGLPFGIVEGFPLLQVLVPDIPPGSYTAQIISGPDRTPVHQITLVVEPKK